jgi:hypothetical protein
VVRHRHQHSCHTDTDTDTDRKKKERIKEGRKGESIYNKSCKYTDTYIYFYFLSLLLENRCVGVLVANTTGSYNTNCFSKSEMHT